MFAQNLVIESADGTVTLRCNGETVAQTQRALILHEPPLLPVYYIPRDDVNMALLEPNRHKTTCPVKGEAHYYNLRIGDEIFENAAWSYESPHDDVAEIKDFIAFYDSVVDREES